MHSGSGMQDVNVHSFGSDSGSSSAWGRRTAQLRKAYQKKSVIYATVAVVVLIIVISVSVSVANKEPSSSTQTKSGLTTNGPLFPQPEVSSEQHQANKNELGSSLVNVFYDPLNIPWNVLNDENSPQNKALNWICGRDEYANYSPKKRIQRFALATFYYATYNVAHDFLTTPTDWSSSESWMLDTEECQWEGIKCHSETHQVSAIILPKHAISGSLPIELAILTTIEELDFTSNYIYMEDELNDLWNHLANLKLLLFEDNFMVTDAGLPSQFAGLTSIEKVQLSYNLLQGELQPEVFQGMQALRHFEIESNYISGDIPAAVGQLPGLVYFYARRNIFSIQFDQLILPGSYPSIFSLWLDNNNVYGTIPPTIGDLTGLASFSITNATLAGSIPTEFGKLQNLRRVWLYDNDLTGNIPLELNQLQKIEVFEVHNNELLGSMPESICNSVAGSSYEFRQLTADCDRVACENCCTACYSG